MPSTLPVMMTAQAVSRLAQRDAPRTRPTIHLAERPVRRSLYVELDSTQKESLYCQHNSGPTTTANGCHARCANAQARTNRNRVPAANAIRFYPAAAACAG